jgi:UDP-glucose 4-epimerase
MFKSRTLLITGGTGTFGNAVVDMGTKAGFGKIRIFSRDEKKQDDMRNRLRNSSVGFYLDDGGTMTAFFRRCAAWTLSFTRQR